MLVRMEEWKRRERKAIRVGKMYVGQEKWSKACADGVR